MSLWLVFWLVLVVGLVWMVTVVLATLLKSQPASHIVSLLDPKPQVLAVSSVCCVGRALAERGCPRLISGFRGSSMPRHRLGRQHEQRQRAHAGTNE